MFPTVVAPTGVVLTVKLADDEFAGTVTELGTEAAGLALAKPTSAPPVGAGAVKLTVPVVACPPVTLEGFRASELRLACPVAGGL